MSRQDDGTFICDRDGVDVGNGGVVDSLVVSDLDPDNPGTIRNLHFCRDREEDGKKIKGCASYVLSARNLEHYRSEKEKHDAT